MEVSASGTCTRSEVQQGSDDVTNALQCEQCHDNGRFEVAAAFCSNCTDYLCTDCVRQHRQLRASKDHTILEGTAMPKKKPRDTDGDECPEHRGKLIELYCHSDRTLACVLCIAESHRACTDVTSVSKLSAGLEHSEELKDFKMSVRKQKQVLGECRKVIDEYRVLNGDWYDTSVGEFEAFKSKIEGGLELLRKGVYSEAGQLKERNAEKLDHLSESLNSLEQELESMMSDIETKETMRKMDQLFIAVKKNTNEIVENRQRTNEMKKDLHIKAYTFVGDHTIQQIIDRMVSTSPMKVLSGDVKCTSEINVKTTEDKEDCTITGLVEISPTDIVAADSANNCLKHINVDSKIIVTRRTLHSPPSTVTVIPGSRVAVTITDEQEIHYFDTKKQLASCGSIRVDGKCFGIQSTYDTLIVSFLEPGKVEMMDFTGRVKRSFTTDSNDTPLFERPWYLSLSPDQTNIHVNNAANGEMTCLSTGGRVNWKYTVKYKDPEEREDSDDDDCDDDNDDDEKEEEEEKEEEKKSEDVDEPNNGGEEEQGSQDDRENDDEGDVLIGFATGTDGCLYICGGDSLHVVSPAGIRLRVIPVTQYNKPYVGAVCCSKIHEFLYVSSWIEAHGECNLVRRLSFQ